MTVVRPFLLGKRRATRRDESFLTPRPAPLSQIEILTVKGAHFYEMGMRAADLVVLGQARWGHGQFECTV